MRLETLSIFLAVFTCCKATYLPAKYGYGLNYNVAGLGYTAPGLGYNIPGLGYTAPALSKVVAQPGSIPSLGYNTVVVKTAPAAGVQPVAPVAPVAPVEERYGIIYDGGVAYLVVDGGYTGSYLDNGVYSEALKSGYGSNVAFLRNIAYPLKK